MHCTFFLPLTLLLASSTLASPVRPIPTPTPPVSIPSPTLTPPWGGIPSSWPKPTFSAVPSGWPPFSGPWGGAGPGAKPTAGMLWSVLVIG